MGSLPSSGSASISSADQEELMIDDSCSSVAAPTFSDITYCIESRSESVIVNENVQETRERSVCIKHTCAI